MKTLFYLGLAASVVAIGEARASSLFYWDPLDGGNGHYYEPVPFSAGLSWNAAKLEAESRGGYLATITSSAENEFVFSLINSPDYWEYRYDFNTSNGPIIGGFQINKDNEPSGNFGWVTGESFSYVSFVVGQPDNWLDSEDYVIYWTPSAGATAATWNDVNESYSGAYIIEYSQVPESSTAGALAGLGMIVGGIYQTVRRKAESKPRQ